MKHPLFKIVAVVFCTGALALGVITLAGDNLRTLFGQSSNALAGESVVARRTTHSNNDLERKSLRNFAGNDSNGASSFEAVTPNPTTLAALDHRSTFAIDVDTASYTYARRVLSQNQRPEPASIRVEEWVNAFHYSLRAPSDEPFAVEVEGAPSPYDASKTLLRVALQGRRVDPVDRKPAHLVFLVDTSGSMQSVDRLPLAKKSLAILVSNLNARDTVAIATYAGDTRVVLEPTKASERATILGAIERLSAGGGTAMGSGMELAYRMAVQQVRRGEVSRVIVLTDGDANIGRNVTSEQILASIKSSVDEGVTLTTVGFGMGNYRAAALEQLADHGNGQALYIDSERAAKQVFGEGLAGTIETIAKDVKVQVDFDQSVVERYRLLGYENRAVADADFRNDRVDGGELGAGHSVTALYELTLKRPGSLGTVYVRGLHPDTNTPFELATAMPRTVVHRDLVQASADLRFATSVALAADLLRGNTATDWPLERIVELARDASEGIDERLEFASLLRRATQLPLAAANPYDGY